MNSHTLRVHDLAICYIVSDRKQRPNEYLITLLPFGEPGIAVHAGIGQQFGQEAAFGPGWNDDGVLQALRLHQSQYLGTEIVTPVGPARSEEHTSELQSLMRNSYAVFCLKQKINQHQP